ncbi:hypothetical protein D3C80_1122720 [compost metagenome]
MLIIGLVYLIIKTTIHYLQQNAYKKQALKTIKNITSTSPEPYLTVLKNTAIQAYGREQVAGLYGKTWIDFLDRSINGKQSIASIEHFFGNELYTETATVKNTEELKNYVIFWIKHHAARLA